MRARRSWSTVWPRKLAPPIFAPPVLGRTVVVLVVPFVDEPAGRFESGDLFGGELGTDCLEVVSSDGFDAGTYWSEDRLHVVGLDEGPLEDHAMAAPLDERNELSKQCGTEQVGPAAPVDADRELLGDWAPPESGIVGRVGVDVRSVEMHGCPRGHRAGVHLCQTGAGSSLGAPLVDGCRDDWPSTTASSALEPPSFYGGVRQPSDVRRGTRSPFRSRSRLQAADASCRWGRGPHGLRGARPSGRYCSGSKWSLARVNVSRRFRSGTRSRGPSPGAVAQDL